MPTVIARWSNATFRQVLKSTKDRAHYQRLRAVFLAGQGLSTAKIAERVGFSSRWVTTVIGRWNRLGPDGIANPKRMGQPKRLPAAREAQFKARIKAGPVVATDGEISGFILADAQRILREEFGAAYTIPGVFRLMQRLNLSWKVPRPKHPKGDPKEQEEWVNTTAPLLSSNPAPRTPTSESSSGSKTKRGSGKRGR